MRKYLIFNIALFTQFLPEIFSYSNDFFLLIYFIYLFVTKKILNKLIVSPLILILFLVTIKIIFSHNFPLFKQFFSDYRPFLVFGILYYTTFEIDAIPYRNKIFYFLIIIILLSIPNLIGMISQPYYSSILKYYYRYVIGGFENSDNTNIAQISSLNGRFSSIFGQPATSGFFFFITTILSFRLLFFNLTNTKVQIFFLIIILALSIFNGLVTKSAFYQFGFLPLILIYLYLRFKFAKIILLFFFIFLSIFSFFILISIFLEDFILFFEYLTSGRYSENGNIIPLMKTVKPVNFLLGFFYIDPNTKAAGDSSLWMKFLQGGLVYVFFYYYHLKKNLHRLYIIDTKFKLFFISIFFTMFLGEIGFTVFSQPKATFISFILIKMFIRNV